MSKELRNILKPLSWVYKQITSVRNKMYDSGYLKSTKFSIPVIVVGNLSVGGTGKTPQVEYLIQLLKDNYKVAVLSRGYKRKSKGFILANTTSNAEILGDEPYQYYKKFKDIFVAVDADRTNGIAQLQKKVNPDIVLLDDAFQHRKVQGGLNVLLTPYNDLYTEDTLLPAGNLREPVTGAERAQVIVVTKCPTILTEEQQFETAQKLNPTLEQTVFFSTISYGKTLEGSSTIKLTALKDYHVVLVTGIANSKPLVQFLESKVKKITHKKYADHHHFSQKEINDIKNTYTNIATNKIIITTEKDYVRIFGRFLELSYLPIKIDFLAHKNDFDKIIVNYVEQSTRNGCVSKK